MEATSFAFATGASDTDGGSWATGTTAAPPANPATVAPKCATTWPFNLPDPDEFRPSRGRVRVVVLEPESPAQPIDRLDAEFDVALRAATPARVEWLSALLAHHRPKLLLLKYPLDSIDERMIAVCLAHRARTLVLAQPRYGLLGQARVCRFGGLPWMALPGGRARPGMAWLKRCCDVVLTMLSIPVSVPLMLLIAVLVGRDGPPLYSQYRVGMDGRLFRMLKFRTMRVHAEAASGPAMAVPDDPRVTVIGRVLRQLRLDELPQLWNVLRGDMSLVGPRPERPEFITQYLRLPHYGLRSHIRPGLTGIAQLTGGYASTVEEKLRCDLLYLTCWSLKLDLKLLLLTALEFLRGFPRG